MIYSRTVAQVAGLMATPTRFPNALMLCTVRDRLLLPSQWTKNESVPACCQRADDRRSHRKIGHEMSVHYVHVDAVRSGTRSLCHLIAQMGEIGGEDRRSELHCITRHVSPLSLR